MKDACPACGALLRGWRYARPVDGAEPLLIWRCVSCRTGVTDAPAPPAAQEEHLRRLRDAIGIEQAPGTTDAVTLRHVLEHLDDPAAALDAIAGRLSRGGVLLIEVPNFANVPARFGGRRRRHLDVPRRRTHFTPAGLATLLARHGFTVERTRGRGGTIAVVARVS